MRASEYTPTTEAQVHTTPRPNPNPCTFASENVRNAIGWGMDHRLCFS